MLIRLLVVELSICCCGSVVGVVAVVALITVESQCGRAAVCTCVRVYVQCVGVDPGSHANLLLVLLLLLKIRVRASIMCRPWTQICRLIFGFAKFSSKRQETCGNVRKRPECVKTLLGSNHTLHLEGL